MKNVISTNELVLPADIQAKIDDILEAREKDKRWNDTNKAVALKYHKEGIPIRTICRILETVDPDREWPYTVVNGFIQNSKRSSCERRGDSVQ
jgi:hypothetical protein